MKKISFLLTVILLICIFSGCSKSDVYNKKRSSQYKEIKSVEGVSFEVPGDWISKATAITEISNRVNLNYNDIYSYKDTHNFLLFCMSSYIIIVSNDVDYNIQSSSKSEVTAALSNYCMLGLSIDGSKNITYNSQKKNGVTKLIAKVNTELLLTTEFYNVFQGQLAYISDGNSEYALFVGIAADSYDAINESGQKLIDYVARSFCISESKDENIVVTPPINNPENDYPENTPLPEEIPEESIPEESVEDNTADNTHAENQIDPNEQETSPGDSSPGDSPEVPGSSDEIPEDAETPQDTLPDDEDEPIVDKPVYNEPAENDPAENDPVKDDPINEPEEDDQDMSPPDNPQVEEPIVEDQGSDEIEDDPVAAGIILNNQKEKNPTSGPQMSNIYSMLSIGQTGYLSVLNSVTKKQEIITITPTNLYTGDAAVDIIKEYCSSDNCPYTYSDPAEGTSWHVIEYTLDYEGSVSEGDYLPYVNVKVLGLDGEHLIHRGITYSKKTHDIFSHVTNAGNREYTHFYAFYEIPNGCTRYMIEAGNGTIENIDNGIVSAYYSIEL